jgi:hypothetical protein
MRKLKIVEHISLDGVIQAPWILGNHVFVCSVNGELDLRNPQSLNLYSYVGNNPLRVAYPDGHDGDNDEE